MQISSNHRTTWLRTDRPVIPTNTATWKHLSAVERALQYGVFAIEDKNRPEFYEFEVDDQRYYIHIPKAITGVYLIAVGSAARSMLSRHVAC